MVDGAGRTLASESAEDVLRHGQREGASRLQGGRARNSPSATAAGLSSSCGDVQIAARVASGEINAVFFFLDPLTAQPHDPDIQALMRVCNVHNIPLATNLATADLIIAGLADEERVAAFREAERAG